MASRFDVLRRNWIWFLVAWICLSFVGWICIRFVLHISELLMPRPNTLGGVILLPMSCVCIGTALMVALFIGYQKLTRS